tara:strand:+ start:182 stop:745 length:564 start_codon:yes stop_codon:yes gene_type:complete
MKSKLFKTLFVVIVGVGCFVGGTYYATKKFNELLDNVMTEYEVISNKVDVFVDVSNPETIRLYTTELRKILDDITLLSRMVQTGQISSEALDGYFLEYDEKLNNMTTLLDSVYLITEDNKTKQGGQIEYGKTQIDNLWREAKSLENKLKEQYDYTSELNIKLQQSINDIKSEIDVIKKSKYGQKIWK